MPSPDISAALVLIAGVLLMLTSVLASSLTEGSRKSLAGWGWALVTIGFVAWVVSFLVAFFRLYNATPLG